MHDYQLLRSLTNRPESNTNSVGVIKADDIRVAASAVIHTDVVWQQHCFLCSLPQRKYQQSSKLDWSLSSPNCYCWLCHYPDLGRYYWGSPTADMPVVCWYKRPGLRLFLILQHEVLYYFGATSKVPGVQRFCGSGQCSRLHSNKW